MAARVVNDIILKRSICATSTYIILIRFGGSTFFLILIFQS